MTMADTYLQFAYEVFCKTYAEREWLLDQLAGSGPCIFDVVPLKNETESGAAFIILSSQIDANLEDLANILQEFLHTFRSGLGQQYIITFAITCSKPRPDSFSGGAIGITEHKIVYADPFCMAADILEDEMPFAKLLSTVQYYAGDLETENEQT